LTGAGRSAEAAEAFVGLMKFQHPNGTGSAMLTKKELIYNITESYYNAGNLAEAEKYCEQLKTISADSDNYKLIQRKIELKKLGFK
jgi:hypothetical protein